MHKPYRNDLSNMFLFFFFLQQPTAKYWQTYQHPSDKLDVFLFPLLSQMSTQFSSRNLFPHSGPNYKSWLAVWGHHSGVFLDLRTQREQTQREQTQREPLPPNKPKTINLVLTELTCPKVLQNSPFAIRRLPAEANWLSILNIHKVVTDKSGLQWSPL